MKVMMAFFTIEGDLLASLNFIVNSEYGCYIFFWI